MSEKETNEMTMPDPDIDQTETSGGGKTGRITVILVEPDRYAKVTEIENTLEALQAAVGGDIEEYMPFEDDAAIICNEEGKINGLPLNRAVYSEGDKKEPEVLDIIAGTFLICYAPIDSEEFKSMPKEMAAKYKEKFRLPEKFIRTPKGIEVRPYKPSKEKVL